MPQSYPDSFIYVRYTNTICIILEIATAALNTVAHCVSRGLNLTKNAIYQNMTVILKDLEDEKKWLFTEIQTHTWPLFWG